MVGLDDFEGLFQAGCYDCITYMLCISFSFVFALGTG